MILLPFLLNMAEILFFNSVDWPAYTYFGLAKASGPITTSWTFADLEYELGDPGYAAPGYARVALQRGAPRWGYVAGIPGWQASSRNPYAQTQAYITWNNSSDVDTWPAVDHVLVANASTDGILWILEPLGQTVEVAPLDWVRINQYQMRIFDREDPYE